ncbi:MAG: hypothetical protein ACOYVG_07130 [Bacteroidota bacterium]
MKKIAVFFICSSLLILFSCKKEANDFVLQLNGKWNWKSSLASNGTQMFPRDNSAIDSNFLIFTSTKFINHAVCVIGGPSEGNFETNFSSGKQYLIFKQEYYRPDTFLLNITSTQLDLTEVHDRYSWTHTFTKKNNE